MTGKLAGLRVLIAEDELLLAEILIDLVKLHGGTPLGPALSEREAVDIIDRTTVDAAVLDVVLASGPCYSLAELLIDKNIPVILTTGHTVSQIPDSFSELPLFSKPFHMESLVERIADRCRG